MEPQSKKNQVKHGKYGSIMPQYIFPRKPQFLPLLTRALFPYVLKFIHKVYLHITPYDRRSVSIVFVITILTSVLILIYFLIYILLSSSSKMVRTRSQLENLSKEKLIEERVTFDDITSKISDLTNPFDDFLKRFEVVSSDLSITRNCNRLLTERVVQLERNAVTNAQYHRRESVKVIPVSPSISDE